MLATNVIDLLPREELYGLLRLCGTDRCLKDGHASDFDLFVALCKTLPFSTGHSFATSVRLFLQKYFELSLPIIPQNAEKIWKLTAEKLLLSPTPVTESAMAFQEEPSVELPDVVWEKREKFFLTNLLCDTDADTWESWENEMRERLVSVMTAAPRRLRFDLNLGVSRQKPSLYHVEAALKKKKRSADDCAVLEAQVFRFLSSFCATSDVEMILYIHSCGNEVGSFLQHMKKSVGLPQLICVVDGETEQGTLLELLKEGTLDALLALDRLFYPSAKDFETAVKRLARQYPLGRLHIIGENTVGTFF